MLTRQKVDKSTQRAAFRGDLVEQGSAARPTKDGQRRRNDPFRFAIRVVSCKNVGDGRVRCFDGAVSAESVADELR